jgi:hypothetical protein
LPTETEVEFAGTYVVDTYVNPPHIYTDEELDEKLAKSSIDKVIIKH